MVAPPQAAFLKTIRIQGSQGTRDVSKKVDHDGTAAKIDSLNHDDTASGPASTL